MSLRARARAAAVGVALALVLPLSAGSVRAEPASAGREGPADRDARREHERSAARPPSEPEPGRSPRSEADSAQLSGVEEPAEEPGDAGRTAADVALFLPRNAVDLLFKGTAAAAGLVRDEQIVPRVAEALAAPGGQLIVFPTMFVETGEPLSFGARMIARADAVTTSYRVGYGVPEDYVFEGRIRYFHGSRFSFALTLEALHEFHAELDYVGVGQTPELDPRNTFLSPADGTREGLYREQRTRYIGSLGLRPSRWFELFLSASLTRRQIGDAEDVGSQALSRVFAPGSVPGGDGDNWMLYTEWAARLDSRATRGRPSPGALVEGYFGGALSVAQPSESHGNDVAYMRAGGRLAGFIPIYRRTNILSPRLVLDHLVPLNGLPVPFTELPRQPDFRGFDNRRDGLSLVGSVDYSWSLVEFLGARLFADVATVAPKVSEFTVDHVKELRFAGGMGLDLFISSDDVGQVAVSGSSEGVRLLLSIGVPSDYGDRQHRD